MSSSKLYSSKSFSVSDIICIKGVWRDKLSFTWDYRTFNFQSAILKAAKDLLPTTKATNFGLLTPAPKIDRPYPDYAQLQFVLSFETEVVEASAVINAVLTKEGWKIYTMHTVAEKLKQFPEVPPADGHMTGPVSWEKQRALEIDNAHPEILIIGGGQKWVAPPFPHSNHTPGPLSAAGALTPPPADWHWLPDARLSAWTT